MKNTEMFFTEIPLGLTIANIKRITLLTLRKSSFADIFSKFFTIYKLVLS